MIFLGNSTEHIVCNYFYNNTAWSKTVWSINKIEYSIWYNVKRPTYNPIMDKINESRSYSRRVGLASQ